MSTPKPQLDLVRTVNVLNPGPFGNPDGSRAAIEELMDGFVSFGNELVFGGLAMKNDDRKARVIVGRKGSGKTVYLRRLQATAVKEESLYADDIQQKVPNTDTIVKFCQWFSDATITEKWTELWRCAIIRSLVSHLMCVPRLNRLVPTSILAQLKTDFERILPKGVRTPVTAYSQVTQIIETNQSANSIRSYFTDSLWDQLEWLIADALKYCPPLCFFVDSVDEEFEHAPMYWLRCQLGLFYETMRMLRDSRIGGTLHVFVCIRDLVLSSVFRSEHRTRYINEPHIRILNWNRHAVAYLLQKKVEMLDDAHFIGDIKKGKTISSWLGRETIQNSRRTPEPIEQYLLRHTRLLPRDIIILGNRLAEELQKARKFAPAESMDDVIRRTVAEAARIFGDEQLLICGNQITSDSMPGDAARKRYSEIYTGDKEYVKGVTDHLKALISLIGQDRFSQKILNNSRKRAAELFGEAADPYSVLWQNGLLGYLDKRRGANKATFYSEEKMDAFQLPSDRDEYVFHSCLIDSVGIRPIGRMPIV